MSERKREVWVVEYNGEPVGCSLKADDFRATGGFNVVAYVPAEARQSEAWVSVEKRLPEKREVVLFVAPDGLGRCCGYTNGKVWLDLLDMYAQGPQEYDASDIEFWRPLPPPPKSSKRGE